MEKGKIIEILNTDLQDEHGAIIQYLTHAYAMGEGEMACEIEAIAREEMRHLDWLAETIVELGGQPSLKRGTMNMAGKAVPEWMANDVGLEEGAITNYKKHIEMIDDPKVKRLLKRILSDEQAHHGDFLHFVDKAKREDMQDIRGSRQDGTTEVLNWGIPFANALVGLFARRCPWNLCRPLRPVALGFRSGRRMGGRSVFVGHGLSSLSRVGL